MLCIISFPLFNNNNNNTGAKKYFISNNSSKIISGLLVKRITSKRESLRAQYVLKVFKDLLTCLIADYPQSLVGFLLYLLNRRLIPKKLQQTVGVEINL